jgi:allophanate hydrolase
MEVLEKVIHRRDALADRALFITETLADALRKATRAVMAGPRNVLLKDILFAVKHNIDVAGLAITAAFPAYAFPPEKDATVIMKYPAPPTPRTAVLRPRHRGRYARSVSRH